MIQDNTQGKYLGSAEKGICLEQNTNTAVNEWAKEETDMLSASIDIYLDVYIDEDINRVI